MIVLSAIRTILIKEWLTIRETVLTKRARRFAAFILLGIIILLVVENVMFQYDNNNTRKQLSDSISISREVSKKVWESEKILIQYREKIARDSGIISILQKEDIPSLFTYVLLLDSTIRNELKQKKDVAVDLNSFTFAIYDSTLNIISWTESSRNNPIFTPKYSPQLDISKRQKGIYFEILNGQAYITAYHRVVTGNMRQIAIVVCRLLLNNNGEIYPNTIHSQSVLDKIKSDNAISIAFNSLSSLKKPLNSIYETDLLLEEGGPYTRIHYSVSFADSDIFQRSFLSPLNIIRDFLITLLITLILIRLVQYVITRSTIVRNSKRQTRIIYGQIFIILIITAFRLIYYLSDSLYSIIPQNLSSPTIFAYNTYFITADPLSLIITAFCISLFFVSSFILYFPPKDSMECKPIFNSREYLEIPLLFIINVLALILSTYFILYTINIIVTNSGISYRSINDLISITPTSLPLISIFIVSLSTILFIISVEVRSVRYIQLRREREKPSIIFPLLVSITAICIYILQHNNYDLSDLLGSYSLIISIVCVLAVLSILWNNSTQSMNLPNSAIGILITATLMCFVVAPEILHQSIEIQKTTLQQILETGVRHHIQDIRQEVVGAIDNIIKSSRQTNDDLSIYDIKQDLHSTLQEAIPEISLSFILFDRNNQQIRNTQYDVSDIIQYKSETESSLLKYFRTRLVTPMSRVDTVLPDKKAIIVIISLLNQQYLFIQCSYDPPSSYTYNDGSFIVYSPSEQFTNLLLPSIIPQLSQEVIQDALVSRSWVNYSYNNTLYNISCKSKYSKKSPPYIEFIAAGIPSLTQTEIFLYGLKASPLVLILVFIVLFLVIFQRSNYSLRKLSLRFRDRIFIIIFFIALLPIIIISNFSKTIITDQITKAEREQLIIRSANIQQILRDVLRDSLQRIYLQEILQRLGRSIDAQIDLYSGSGCIVASNNISDYINLKQSLIMPPDVYLTLNWHISLFTLVEREGLSSLLSSAFRSIQLDQSKKYAFVGITSTTNLAQIEEKNSTTMSIIYGTLSLLSLLLLIIGSYISYRVASPLQEIITATDLVAKGDLAVRLNIQRNDEIGDLAGAFNRMTNELEKSRDRVAQSEREVAWKEMARQVAHEIKNPLTPMKLSVQHVQHSFQENDTNFPSVFQRVMRTLSEQIDVLTRIATEFSRFGEMPRRRYAFISLKNVIESAVRLFDSERPRIRFVIDIPERISSVYADEEEFRRALVNLLRNAIQAIEGWGIIVISAVETRGLIHLKITDTGTGMSEETLRKVFDPNFSTKTSGMGLGLAIVKKTITDMSGTITVESEIGRGTTFTIDLPARES